MSTRLAGSAAFGPLNTLVWCRDVEKKRTEKLLNSSFETWLSRTQKSVCQPVCLPVCRLALPSTCPPTSLWVTHTHIHPSDPRRLITSCLLTSSLPVSSNFAVRYHLLVLILKKKKKVDGDDAFFLFVIAVALPRDESARTANSKIGPAPGTISKLGRKRRKLVVIVTNKSLPVKVLAHDRATIRHGCTNRHSSL